MTLNKQVVVVFFIAVFLSGSMGYLIGKQNASIKVNDELTNHELDTLTLNQEISSLTEELNTLNNELSHARHTIEGLMPLYDGTQIGEYLMSQGINDIIIVQRGELWADQIANTIGLNVVQTIRYGIGSENFPQWEFESADAILLLSYTDAVELMKITPEETPIYGYDGLEYARKLN